MDLIDLGEKLIYDNLGFRYVLTVIDTFSKHAWAQPLKSKEWLEVAEAFKEILKFEIPHLLQSDNGGNLRISEWMKLQITTTLNKYLVRHTDPNHKDVLKGSIKH